MEPIDLALKGMVMNPFSERAPYVVTLLFAAIGWSVTHVADRLLKSPVVEYRTNIDLDAGDYSVTLHNVSRDRVYKKVTVVFMLPTNSPGKFHGRGGMRATPPAWEGENQPVVEPNSVRFEIPELHPDWEIALKARFSGRVPPRMSVETAEPAIRLVESSLETFVLRNEIRLVVATLVLWGFALLLVVARPRLALQAKRPAYPRLTEVGSVASDEPLSSDERLKSHQ